VKTRLGRAALAEALAWAARALPHRPPVPALAGIQLTASDGLLTVSAFDYEVSARFETNADVMEPGTALVSGRLLSEIARALPDMSVELTTDGPDLVLACGDSQFALPSIPLDDYPPVPDMPETRGTIDGAAFGEAVTQVTIAAGRDGTLPALTGIRIEISNRTLRLVATDRYRLAVRDIPWQPEDPDLDAVALVPARSLHEIAKSLAKDEQVTIALSTRESAGGSGLIGFQAGSRRATTRLLDSEFVKYHAIFPTAYTGTAVIERLPLLEAVRRVALVTQRHTPLRLSLSPGRIALDAGSRSEARGRETLRSDFEGDDICIAVHAGYLIEGLSVINTRYLELGYTTPTKPAVLTPRASGEPDQDPDYRYLFMPLRSA